VKHYRLDAEAAVEFDIESAFGWYEAEEPGLGLEFLEQLRLVYRRILENPLNMTLIRLHLNRLNLPSPPSRSGYCPERTPATLTYSL
jgi:hypothetical protein